MNSADSEKTNKPVADSITSIKEINLPSYSNPSKIRTRIDHFLLTHPQVSTWMVAFALASIWLLAWILVLFTLTLSSESPTSAFVFVAGLVLSTVAEACIRLAENSSRAERWSRGNLQKEKSNFKPSTAIAWLTGGVLFVLVLPDLTTLPTTFELTRESEAQKIPAMAVQWLREFSAHPRMAVFLFFCLAVRTVIYHRSASTVTWVETKEHVRNLKG